MEKIILTEEEIKSLTQLKVTYQQYMGVMGDMGIQEIEIGMQKEKIKEGLLGLKQKEMEISKELEDKYGKGNISLETGEFTPIVEETEEA
jgi:hypothetical protein